MAVVKGGYRKIPISERVCPCGLGGGNNREYSVPLLVLSGEMWKVYLMRKFSGFPEVEMIKMLLTETNLWITIQCASFLAAACKTHNGIVRNEGGN